MLSNLASPQDLSFSRVDWGMGGPRDLGLSVLESDFGPVNDQRHKARRWVAWRSVGFGVLQRDRVAAGSFPATGLCIEVSTAVACS